MKKACVIYRVVANKWARYFWQARIMRKEAFDCEPPDLKSSRTAGLSL